MLSRTFKPVLAQGYLFTGKSWLFCQSAGPYNKLPRTSCNKSIAEYHTIITRAAVLMFQLLQATIINQMRPWNLRVNIRQLINVDLNITIMHNFNTARKWNSRLFLSKVGHSTTITPHHQWWRRESVCHMG